MLVLITRKTLAMTNILKLQVNREFRQDCTPPLATAHLGAPRTGRTVQSRSCLVQFSGPVEVSEEPLLDFLSVGRFFALQPFLRRLLDTDEGERWASSLARLDRLSRLSRMVWSHSVQTTAACFKCRAGYVRTRPFGSTS